MTRKPFCDIAYNTEGGGAAPAVIAWTTWGRGRIVSSLGALTIVLRTTGAAQKCVTLYLAMAE